jgi:hypothetical protein
MGNPQKHSGVGEGWWSRTLLQLSHAVNLKQIFPKCHTEMDNIPQTIILYYVEKPRGNSMKYHFFRIFILHPDSSFPLTFSHLYLLPSFPT